MDSRSRTQAQNWATIEMFMFSLVLSIPFFLLMLKMFGLIGIPRVFLNPWIQLFLATQIQFIRQSFFWELIYNGITIPVTAMGLLSPLLAGAAMAFSSVSVVLNALRLKWVTLDE